MELALSRGIPQLLSLPSLTNIVGCFLLSPSCTWGSVEGGCLWFWCLYSPYSHEDWLVLENEPFSRNKTENKDKYSGNILGPSSLHTGAPVWHLFLAMTLMLFFSSGKQNKEWLFYTHTGRGFWGVADNEVWRCRDSPQAWPGPWLWADTRGVWERGDAQGTFHPEWSPSSRAVLLLMPAAWCFPHYTPDSTSVCPSWLSTSVCPSSFIKVKSDVCSASC